MSADEQAQVKGKTGVVYLSRLPPGMNAHKIKVILGEFGPLGRAHFRKEAKWRREKRIAKGGSSKEFFEDGWVEFERKIDAKLCEEAFKPDAPRAVAKMGRRWSSDNWNIRYLHGFKWKDLEAALEAERSKTSKAIHSEASRSAKTSKQWLKKTKARAVPGKVSQRSAPTDNKE